MNFELHKSARHQQFFVETMMMDGSTKPLRTHKDKALLHMTAPDEQTQIASLNLSLNAISDLLTRRIKLTQSKN